MELESIGNTIGQLIHKHYQKFMMHPTRLYIGRDEFILIRAEYLDWCNFNVTTRPTCQGLEIFEVNENSHLAVY